MVELLERARQQFDLCKDYSGMGDCQLGLAQLRRDKKLLEEAYKNFGTTQPFPNVAGMLECVEVRKYVFVPDDSKRLVLLIFKACWVILVFP